MAGKQIKIWTTGPFIRPEQTMIMSMLLLLLLKNDILCEAHLIN